MGTPPGRFKFSTRLPPISERDWDFSTVPDSEVVACCFWEHARESIFIRKTVQDLKDVEARKGSRKTLIRANRDLTRFYSVGTPAHLVCHLKFPEPWQSLPNSERARLGKSFKAEIPVAGRIPPFRATGDYSISNEIFGLAKRVHERRLAIYYRLSQIDQGTADPREANELRKELAETPPFPILRGEGGVDSFLTQVNWQDFTDKEIVAAFNRWVTENRPIAEDTRKLVGRRDDKGRKLNDWRAILDRLSIMRLLHHSTVREMPTKVPKAWKQHSSADWYRARKHAKDDFHRLFPFPFCNELPMSWKTQGRAI
jgi:hypothetical protein